MYMLRSKQITTRKKKIRSALKASFWVIYVACEYAWISRQTYHNYVKNDKDFSERVNT
jgi:hypothetical protein